VQVVVSSGSVIVSCTVSFPETVAGLEQKSSFFSLVSQPDAPAAVFTGEDSVLLMLHGSSVDRRS
jgi:hypothetical protein